MTRTIHEQVFNPEKITDEGYAELQLPPDALVLSVGTRRDLIFIWYEVRTPLKPLETHRFFIGATGQAVPEDVGDYIGSCVVMDQGLVLHVYHG